ncbi:hypothetical protein Dimus_032047 [Dionaea muscipula]
MDRLVFLLIFRRCKAVVEEHGMLVDIFLNYEDRLVSSYLTASWTWKMGSSKSRLFIKRGSIFDILHGARLVFGIYTNGQLQELDVVQPPWISKHEVFLNQEAPICIGSCLHGSFMVMGSCGLSSYIAIVEKKQSRRAAWQMVGFLCSFNLL